MQFTAPFRSLLPVSGWVAKVYLAMTFVLQLDLGWCLMIEWPLFTQRLLTLKEINFSVFGLIGCLAVGEAHKLLDYAEAHARRYRNLRLTDDEIAVIAERDATVTRLARTVEILFTSFQVFFGFTPLAAIFLRISLNPHSPFSRLPSVLHIYYPQIYPLNTLATLIIINFLSFFWYFMLVNFWKLNAKSLFVTFQCLVTDMQLLCCAFEIMSKKKGIDEKELRKFLNSAASDHQSICRNMKMLDKVSKKIVVGFMNIYGLQLCVYLIFVTMLDDWSTRLRYIFLYLVMLFILYSIAVNGQKVKDMGETLRLTMCQCEWSDKPAWFRKGILLMITRSTREMIVRPYDLYALDMNCITQIVRATYTYLNLAKKFN